jgi:hypothetical protein
LSIFVRHISGTKEIHAENDEITLFLKNYFSHKKL